MRKVSRADETYDLSFRTANTDRCEGPNCYNKPQSGSRHCKDCEEKVKNPTSRPRTSSVRTAEAWPSEIDHAHHIAEMNKLLDHHMKGEEWHAERGEMEKSRLHATAADALRDAIFVCSEAAAGRHLDNTPFTTASVHESSDKPWDDEDPDHGKHSKLTPEQKAKAKARAKSHGRPYPNWVDNTWAAKHGSSFSFYQEERKPINEAIEATGHEGVPGEGIHPDFEGIDICTECPGRTPWPCKVINDHLNRR